jgi:hypothetical protein
MLMSGPHQGVETQNARLRKDVRQLHEARDVPKMAILYLTHTLLNRAVCQTVSTLYCRARSVEMDFG